MSYDLTVYAPRHADAAELRMIVESIAGLAVQAVDDTEARVVRGKRAAYSFTVFGPYRIEPEDVPAAVLPQVLDPTVSWQVIVEGSIAGEVPFACRFAKKLALAVGGVALDEQSGELLGAGKSRAVPAPSSERVSILDLNWYTPAAGTDPGDGPRLWLELAESLLPEALPRRFGNYEPFQYRLDRDGPDRFLACYRDEKYLLGFTTRRPCLGGNLGVARGAPVVCDHLAVLTDPLRDPHWRNTIRRFFTTYAARRGAVLATGAILRNYLLRSGGAASDGKTENEPTMSAPDGVYGLPPHPVWWTWLGNDYLDLPGKPRLLGRNKPRLLVRDYLPADATRFYPAGAFYAATDEPIHHRDLRRRRDPFPAALRSTAVPGKYALDDLRPARIRPLFNDAPQPS